MVPSGYWSGMLGSANEGGGGRSTLIGGSAVASGSFMSAPAGLLQPRSPSARTAPSARAGRERSRFSLLRTVNPPLPGAGTRRLPGGILTSWAKLARSFVPRWAPRTQHVLGGGCAGAVLAVAAAALLGAREARAEG